MKPIRVRRARPPPRTPNAAMMVRVTVAAINGLIDSGHIVPANSPGNSHNAPSNRATRSTRPLYVAAIRTAIECVYTDVS